MSPDLLLIEALKLPTQARADLAGRLLETLDDDLGEEDTEVEEAWRVEIARRVAELDSGQVQAVPWEQVRRELLARRVG